MSYAHRCLLLVIRSIENRLWKGTNTLSFEFLRFSSSKETKMMWPKSAQFFVLNVRLWCCERCLDRRCWFPPEEPRVCNGKPGIYRSRHCCDKDFCNRNLHPGLLSSASPELRPGIQSPRFDQTMLSLISRAASFIFFLPFFFFFGVPIIPYIK